MKLSISTLGCPEWDFLKIITEYERLGMDIEARGIDGEMDADKIKRFYPENAEQTKSLMKAHNVKFAGFGSSVTFHDEKSLKDNIESGRRTVDICQLMGIDAIRVFGDRIPDKSKTDETVARVIHGISEVCSYASDKNININLETHGDFNTIEVIKPLIGKLSAYKNFGILWDIQHSDRIYGADYKKFYDLVKPLVRHTHIKDYIITDDGIFKICPPGEGIIPIKDIVNMLLADGYDGYFSLEWEKKWVPEIAEPEEVFPKYLEFMKSI